MTQKIVPVIMAGGKGTRLWPLSRSAAPKQFIRFIGDTTLFQETLLRVSDPDLYEPAIVITNEEFRFLVAEQARELDIALSTILLEPMARNTAAAVAAAGALVRDQFGEDTIIHVLASDHEIDADEIYFNAVRTAVAAAFEGKLVTFGIKPTEPATGYGYIEGGDALPSGAQSVKRFIEKPPLAEAEKMLARAASTGTPACSCSRSPPAERDGDLCARRAEGGKRSRCPGRQGSRLHPPRQGGLRRKPRYLVDYAIMEKTGNAAVVPSPFKWSDLGSWDAIWKSGTSDARAMSPPPTPRWSTPATRWS
jgi:mannose-1-phosphate guanylyltransferase